MDQRKEALKVLKKASKKVKRKKTALWKTIAVISLIFALVLAPLSIMDSIFDNTMAAFFGDSFWDFFGIISAFSNMIRILAIVFGVIYVAALIPWIRGKRQWKRSQEYLDYKTLKTALKTEEKEK